MWYHASIPMRQDFTQQFEESLSVKPAVKPASPCFKELQTHKFMALDLLENFSIKRCKCSLARFSGKFSSNYKGVVCAWVHSLHISGSRYIIVVSYFWAQLYTLQNSLTSSESCWMWCPPLLSSPNHPPSHPPFWQKLSSESVWLQSSHTLHSILSLQTEGPVPLPPSPWVNPTLSLCVGQSEGPCSPKTFIQTHKAVPASWCKGNSRGPGWCSLM